MHTSFITALKSPVVHSKRGRRQTRACARACVLVQKIVLKMKKKKKTNKCPVCPHFLPLS